MHDLGGRHASDGWLPAEAYQPRFSPPYCTSLVHNDIYADSDHPTSYPHPNTPNPEHNTSTDFPQRNTDEHTYRAIP